MSTILLAPPLPASAAEQFGYWWNVPGDWVEAPNERRSGWSGVLRVRHRGRIVFVKRQRNHLCRSLFHPLGRPTVSREYANLHRLNALGITVPVPLYHGLFRGPAGVEAVLVTDELRGFAPLAAQRELSVGRRAVLASSIGRVLGRLHRSRLQHGCLYDKHVMVRWQAQRPEIALIDLEKMRRRATRIAAARHDLDQLWRHQTLWSELEWRLLEQSHAEALHGRLRG